MSKPWSSHALRPFTRGVELPYRTPRPGVIWGSPTNRDSKHLIEAVAAAWDKGRMVLGARWLCGATSIGVDVYDPQRYYDDFYCRWPEDRRGSSWEAYTCVRCLAVRDGSNGPCVYRVWDESRERLLYIGSTSDWIARRNSHRRDTWWWQLAKHIDLEHFSTLDAAHAAERAAIQREKPRMNVQHNRSAS